MQLTTYCALNCDTYDDTLHATCVAHLDDCAELLCPVYDCDLRPCLHDTRYNKQDPCEYTQALVDCASENYCLDESHVQSCEAQSHNCQLSCPVFGTWYVRYLSPLYHLASMPHGKELKTITIICICFFVFGIITFVLLVSDVSAPYGRYFNDKWSGMYGPPVPAKLAWVVQECPCVVIPVFLIFHDGVANFLQPKVSSFLLGLYLLHYTNRSFIFPFLIRGGKPTRMVPFLMAFVFCCTNGWMQANYLLRHYDSPMVLSLQPEGYSENMARLGVGTALFFLGMFINIQSDSILRNLRKPGETSYKIPRGGAFEWVSGANFFGEIVEWFGFAVACGTLPAFAFSFFTFSNIGPRGFQHHKWYKQKFENYPKKRKAVIPYIW
eukprot:TRINITY_DN43383_c0_g1_i1.p1 TRINITY_DN43383_c0_g1~~TRINITY_DN43383_c0_g1_i1.p1  ORF type:complete len:443 (-),score=9.66 TRINITY_DN43383_c0_g1_i1:212-1354(-)